MRDSEVAVRDRVWMGLVRTGSSIARECRNSVWLVLGLGLGVGLGLVLGLGLGLGSGSQLGLVVLS